MVLLGGVYNSCLWAIGQAVFPSQAEGSLIRRADGTVVGLAADRAEVHAARVLPAAAVRRRLQRRVDRRHQLRTVESGSLKAVQERLDAVDRSRKACRPRRCRRRW